MPLDARVFADRIRRLLPEDDAPPSTTETGRKASTPWIGAGAVADHIRSLVPRIAASDCNVLITGETGTGKELTAELIHVQSGRARHPFVSINCAAIPETLLESELFGYERGAFTGAGASSSGRLSAAHRGTAFLDEVGDMSPASQAKVLRLVEDKEVTRLGSTRTMRVDARIIAATNQKLEALVAQGRFRSDLFFRLNVARVHLPPLRERKGDIPALLAHYVSALRSGRSGTVEGFSRDAIGALTAYDWPGNIRELRNLVERVLVQVRSAMADVDDLPDEIRTSLEVRRAGCDDETDAKSGERARLRSALAAANGNKSEAARALCCSRMTLYRRMARCGLNGGSRRRA
jgi:two-component system response regulator HydG/two-component system response regulator AtoC